MTNIFKLTKAEFVKIFKRPSIFIMAILIVVTIFASMTFFDPTVRENLSVTYDNATTSQEYYNNFYTDEMINSKASMDTAIAKTDEIINYYQSLNNHTAYMSACYNDVIDTMTQIISEKNETVQKSYRNKLIMHINTFHDAYYSLSSLGDYHELINYTLKEDSYDEIEIENKNNLNFYKSSSAYGITSFKAVATDTTKYSMYNVVQYYTTNNVANSLKSALTSANNFINSTLTTFALDFKTFYTPYVTELSNGRGDIQKIKKLHKNLSTSLNDFYDYYKLLTNSSYPLVLVSKDTNTEINHKVEDAITILKSADTSLESHRNIKANLDTIGISNYLYNLSTSSSIQMTRINNSLISELNSYKNKVNSNAESILTKVNDLANDESITNISKEITNYKLLIDAYDTLVNQKVLNQITDNYSQSLYTNFYGYNFDTYNKYQSNESIALNSYYIDNNTYSNSYLTNFSFNQNTDTKTNMYDFVYFVMEICTLIIIVFAMMLVCSLITGETESGTIKLLLVRPFKRSKIITAKLLATFFFVLSFMIFSGLISMIGGFFLYGEPALSILSVINARTIVKMSPFALMLINFVTLFFDIIFFVLLALMISIICKNYAASITCSLVILIINFVGNMLFGGAFWYSLLPGMNLHLFKYFGNSFISILGSNSSIAGLLQSLLITGIDTSMTLWFSLITSSIYSIVFLAVSYSIFQKRDF